MESRFLNIPDVYKRQVCALVELPNSMGYRYGGIGYNAVLPVDTAQRDSGGAVVPMLYLFDTADEADEAEAEQYLSKLTAGEFSPLMYESKATVRSEFCLLYTSI